jgi:hypothetical protein
MLYKYCPDCASISLQRKSSSEYKCLNCNYIGEVKEDSIDKINTLRKVLKANNNSDTESSYLKKDFTNLNLKENISLKEKLNNKLTKKSSDWELL